jgi:hypothetical protein
VGYVVGFVLALLVAGIPVADATDATLSIKSGEIRQGHIHYDAMWIEAHYEPRTYAWGYYQPYGVPERAC